MTEDELRALVREAIARHHGGGAGRVLLDPPPGLLASSTVRTHTSHAMFALPTGADSDGPCLIEPSVMCSHCGYCKSLGH